MRRNTLNHDESTFGFDVRSLFPILTTLIGAFRARSVSVTFASIFSRFSDAHWALVVFCLSATLASLANCVVDALDWIPRYRSPWRRFPKKIRERVELPRRRALDFIPILGWLSLARLGNEEIVERSKRERAERRPRYSSLPGLESRFFWVRPFIAEILFASLVTARFFFWRNEPSQLYRGALSTSLLCWAFESLLFWFALCCSQIDLDDYVIPDALTIPCFVLGILLATSFPFLIEPVWYPLDATGENSTRSICQFTDRLLSRDGFASSANEVRNALVAFFALIWSFWCFAILDRRFYWRLGFARAFRVFFRRLKRSALTPFVVALWALGIAFAVFVAFHNLEASFASDAGDSSLDALASSLVGLVVGALMIWGVRLIGGSALGVEAMGFGDVVLMGAIGSYLGWRGAATVFFIAPFLGVFFGLCRRRFSSAPEIPYGPFLCLATLVYILERDELNDITEPFFTDPVFTLGVGACGLILLGVSLLILRVLKRTRQRS